LNSVDIIIVNYNSTDYLIKCLESIYDSIGDIPVNIFVQDNDSDDDVNRISEFFPEVLITNNTYNMGFAAAVNQALKQSFSPYIVLLNPDTYIEKGFFKLVICYMEDNPDVGVVGPTIFDHDGSVQGSARSFPTPLTGLFGRKSLLSKLFPGNKITRQNVLTNRCDGITPIEADWVSGACMVVRRKAVEDVGLMDERFFMYWEDADWCKRMRHSGWNVVYFPQATIVHYVGGSSDKLLFRSIFEFHKSTYLLFNKYNKPSIWFMRLIVIAGLSIRLVFTLVSNGIRVWYSKRTHGIQCKKITRAKGRKEKIRILRLIARLNIGGPAIHVSLLTQGIDPERFQSVLVTGKVSVNEGDMSYLADTYGIKPIIISDLQREISIVNDVMCLFRILRIINQEKPDIVHTHTAKAGTVGRIAVFIHNLIYRDKIRVIHTFHGHVFHGYFGRIMSKMFILTERILAKITDIVIAISESQKNELVNKYRIAQASKVRVVKLGFDLEPFFSSKDHPGESTQIFNSGESNFVADKLRIGIVGRLVPIKNHKMFLESAKIFLEQNQSIKATFLIIGDGELREELIAYCKEQRLSDHVQFLGWQKKLPEIYANLDIVALTSNNEGTPVSLIEAMACSVPVIATDVGGVRDLLGNSQLDVVSYGFKICERGILCRENDAKGFVDGIKYLVNNKRLMEEKANAARSFVVQNFSKERLVRDIESLYTELLNFP